MARVEGIHSVSDAVFVDTGFDHFHREFRLMITIAQDQE